MIRDKKGKHMIRDKKGKHMTCVSSGVKKESTCQIQ
jgi:hypothetical protein